MKLSRGDPERSRLSETFKIRANDLLRGSTSDEEEREEERDENEKREKIRDSDVADGRLAVTQQPRAAFPRRSFSPAAQ